MLKMSQIMKILYFWKNYQNIRPFHEIHLSNNENVRSIQNISLLRVKLKKTEFRMEIDIAFDTSKFCIFVAHFAS